MSWTTFRKNILNMSNFPTGVTGIDAVAEKWAMEYDMAVKNGVDIMNFISVDEGNIDTMKQLFKLAFMKGQTSQGPYDIVGELGKGVRAYWMGTQMKLFPIPLVPAAGSTQNIVVLNNNVNVPGNWNPGIPIPPTPFTNIIVDNFIVNAALHLTTIGGTITTLSLYPGAPPFLAPGIINWSGYVVKP
jgi:hypothetical protein